jgi:azurin
MKCRWSAAALLGLIAAPSWAASAACSATAEANDTKSIEVPKTCEAAPTTFKVSALKAGEAYAFFCSFPGHAALMKGTLTLR